MTQQKAAVIDAIRAAGRTHPTADTIYMLAKARLPSIAIGTVYRNLSLMEENGEVRRITVPNGADHYDMAPEEHFHIFCTVCGKLYDVPMENAHIDIVGLPDGFVLDKSSLVMDCVCAECAKKKH